MRTTLDVPEQLMEEARAILGFKSKTDVVIVALQELIRRQHRAELKELAGKLELDIDLPRSRRRQALRGRP